MCLRIISQDLRALWPFFKSCDFQKMLLRIQMLYDSHVTWRREERIMLWLTILHIEWDRIVFIQIHTIILLCNQIYLLCGIFLKDKWCMNKKLVSSSFLIPIKLVHKMSFFFLKGYTFKKMSVILACRHMLFSFASKVILSYNSYPRMHRQLVQVILNSRVVKG